jgi:glycosyltransferase involved in cell wall biosynthesis
LSGTVALTTASAYPLVTIGIPTYMRPELLQKALECVAMQDYPNIELIVSDNCTPGSSVADVVESFRSRLPGLIFVRQPRNIGAYANIFSLLDAAHGKYFMWLADDDELSPNCVSALTRLLEQNPAASSAAANWVTIEGNKPPEPRLTARFPQSSALARCLRFIWHTDDAFFYGMHRTEVLRAASFPGYWWPNRSVLLNWAYVYLLDMVMRGPVLLADDPTVQFFNRLDTVKHYDTRWNALAGILRFVIRRINVHCLYLRKVGRGVGLWAVPIALPVSIVALCRELGSFAAEFLSSVVARLRGKAVSG